MCVSVCVLYITVSEIICTLEGWGERLKEREVGDYGGLHSGTVVTDDSALMDSELFCFFALLWLVTHQ